MAFPFSDPAIKFLSKNTVQAIKSLEDIALEAKLGTKIKAFKEKVGGEDPKKIFSGGMISDIFDIWNLGNYALAGLAKGLFTDEKVLDSIKKGIEERASFADYELLGKYGIGGIIGGVILDILLDPANLAAPFLAKQGVKGILKADKLLRKSKNDLLALPGIGPKSVQEIERALKKLDLALKEEK